MNGEAQEVPEGATVGWLIERLGLSAGVCAAEVNLAVVPRSRRDTHPLHEGDRVEIVTLVGGG